MLEAAGAAAAGYAAKTAYSYNRDRFHFNAKQRQHRIHQSQSMKLELWKLFREDVRDLFELTTSNMNTYMVVGALLVTCIIGFIFVGYQEFPMEPPWLLLIWNNSVFSAITFGILSVWLATHGSSSSNSAAIKILTQAVRPPVPGLSEVRAAMRLQEQYEKSGVKNFFMPPAFVPGATLGGLQEMEGPHARARDPALPEAPLAKRVSDREKETQSKRKFTEKSQMTDVHKEEAEATTWLEEGAHATDDISQLLATVDGGPGKSAAQYSHFWMLRKVQRGYACFDAYARISLTVSAQQLLLVGAYYAIALFMTKTEGWPEPSQNAATGWLSSATAAFAGCILYKLDLFVVKRQRRMVDTAIFLGPLVLTLAVHLAVLRDNNGRVGLRACDQFIPSWAPWSLALVACALHMAWIIIILKVSCPLKSRAGLPMSYRSSIYLDVFGWHSKRFRRTAANATMPKVTVQALPFMSKDRCAAAAFKEAKQISKVLKKFGGPEIVEHLSAAEAEDLHRMQVILEEDVKELEDHLNLPEYEPDDTQMADDGSWLQCCCEDGQGHAALYWVDAHSGQVQLTQPNRGEIIDLSRMSAIIRELQSRIDASPRNAAQEAVAAEARPFELMPEAPDMDETSKNLPWKCIQRSCWMQILLWCFTMVVILVDSDYHASRLAPADSYDRSLVKLVSVSQWPHRAFRPSALSCNPYAKKLLLSDQFEIYSAELNLEGSIEALGYQQSLLLRNLTLQPAIPTAELRSTWKSIGYLHNRGILLLLDRNGRAIVEHHVHRGSGYSAKPWTLSESLPQKLEVIEPIEGRGSQMCSTKGSGLVNMGWAIYASTDSGQVVILCPSAQRVLQPLHMIVSLRRKQASMSIMKLVDSHTGAVKLQREKIIGVQRDIYEGVLWLMVSTTEGSTEIRAWDVAVGQVGRWFLPTGRRWAQGLCLLGPNQGLIMAASADDSSTASNAELWRIIPKLNRRKA